MKRIIGDLLSLIFGGGDENYTPSKGEYTFFGAVVLMCVIMALTLWIQGLTGLFTTLVVMVNINLLNHALWTRKKWLMLLPVGQVKAKKTSYVF